MTESTRFAQSYSQIAAEYDVRRFEGKQGKFLDLRDQEIVRALHGATAAKRTIDVPVGTGRVLRYLPERAIVGVDYTPEMLEIAAKVANPQLHKVMQGDAARLPFVDGEFDCLISLRFFHLFRPGDRKPFASEFLRVVKPGGYLIVSFTNGWYAGGIGWVRRLVGLRTVYFEYPGEMRRLFKGCKRLRRVGNYLPKQRLIEKVPGLGVLFKKATTRWPLNLFCAERYYLLRTPAARDGTVPEV